MKTILLFLLLFVQPFAHPCFPQKTLYDSLLLLQQRNDSLEKQVGGLLRRVDENSYTRIPRIDFDKSIESTLQQKVDRQVSDKFEGLRNMVFLIITLIGGGLLLTLKSTIGNSVKDQIEKERVKNDEKIEKKTEDIEEDLEKRLKNVEDGLKEKIEYIYLSTVKEKTEMEMQQLKNIYADRIKEVEEKIVVLDSRIRMTTINSVEYELYKMTSTRSYTSNDFDKLKGYLNDPQILVNNKLVSDIINELSKAAYYTKRDADMEPVIEKFIDNTAIDIKENTFVNISAGMLYGYAASKDKGLKEKAIKYLNKSLTKVPDYGEALGLKLEYLMVDFENAVDEIEKQKVNKEATIIINQILSSEYACKETLGRFERVRTSSTEKRYIDMIYQLFPEQMQIMATLTPVTPINPGN